MKAGALGALLALAAGSLGCQFGMQAPQAAEQASVPTARAESGEFRVAVEEVGLIAAASSVALSAPERGKVKWLLPEGTEVEEGDRLLAIDTNQLERRLKRHEADVQAARSQLSKQLERIAMQEKATSFDEAKLEAQRDFEVTRFESTKKEATDAQRRAELGLIRASEALTRQRQLEQGQLQHDKAQLGFDGRVSDLRSQQRRLEVAKTEAERRLSEAERRAEYYRRRIARATLRAPVAGKVFHPKRRFRGAAEPRKVRVGDQVTPWTGTIVELPELSTLQVLTQVDETLAGRVVTGVEAEVRPTAHEDLLLRASVASVAAVATPRSQSPGAGFLERAGVGEQEQVVFAVRLVLREHDARLQPGMGVQVTYLLDVLQDAVSVPEDAVFGTPERRHVFVREGASVAEREVELGPTSGGRVVVREGLRRGELVYLGDPGNAVRGET